MRVQDSLSTKIELIARNLVLGAAILVFAKGFFPHKAVLPGLATWPEDTSGRVPAPFDKVIFMVVDALRSDFVYGNASSFDFTQGLIRSGAAIPFTGHASPPTITMPRVKSITTGSVPSFLDLVLNFAESDTSSTLATQDSWLAQLKARPGGMLVMYGDDTWLRLFPNFFDRADGTTSFFVSDFTEVDNNVTRHIPDELRRKDWSGMIMHYLGLDHIGHKTGPRGPNMPAKQLEMDSIVQQIYSAMERENHLQSTLLVLLGDHGMNEAGNHGANSAGEVSTALTFISPKFKEYFEGQASPQPYSEDYRFYDEVDQSDVAPTLAALLGFPVPKNSLGAIIPKMLALWKSKADRHNLLYQNAQQIQQVAYATYPEAFDSVGDLALCTDKAALPEKQRLACKWLAVKEMHQSFMSDEYMFIRDGTQLISSFLTEVQVQLSGTASKYNEKSMFLGIVLAVLCCFPPRISYDTHLNKSGFTSAFFFFMQATYSATMFASSYVEEEHQFWYWITSAWLVSLAVRQQRIDTKDSGTLIRSIGSCVLFGIVRRFNQTGQKYAGEADLAGLLPVLVASSALVFKLAFTAAEAPELMKGLGFLDPILKFASQYPLTSLARVVFLGLANLIVLSLYAETPWASPEHFSSFLETTHDIVSLFLMTQTRTVNIPLFLLFHLQLSALRKGRRLHAFETLLTMLMMQYSSFYAFGGTNAISSVDLSNAYNGIAGYNVLMVGILTFVSNWAGPIWWTSATTCILRSNVRNDSLGRSWTDWFSILSQFAAVHASTVMLACYVLREHLFVWTVFSPKYLYMMAWTFAQHMVVNGFLPGVISGMASV
ncbi:major facilitator superfamily transporter protein [Lithohypha guttulata]|nr:major facilitator superfamily transporter protein [Lithohypha guttulata]